MNFPATKSIALSRAHENRRVDDLDLTLARAAQFARLHGVAAIYRAGWGNPGAVLSSADILACLYGAELNLWPSSVDDPDRDRFVLSSGHAAPTLYAVAAHYGFCSAPETLSFGKFGSPFQGLPVPGCGLDFIEASSGQRAQGFGVALGMALGLKLQRKSARVYTLLGDDELGSGELWEAALAAAHQKLDNFCAILDYRDLRDSSDDLQRIRLEPLASKWRAFDWAVIEVDGHDIGQILAAFRRTGTVAGRPALVIAHTVSGKGVPKWEGQRRWSNDLALTRRDAEDALLALGARHSDIVGLIGDEH